MNKKSVAFERCPCGKRSFATEHDAAKALGRAQAKRRRMADKAGTRRGSKVENRYYLCDYSDQFHLTGQSRRGYDTHSLPMAA